MNTYVEDLLKVTIECKYNNIPIYKTEGGYKTLGKFASTLLGAKSIIDMSKIHLEESVKRSNDANRL